MTIREVYEVCLTELNKVLAPSLLLDDFNYLINKAIQQYVNKRYRQFEVTLQLTDDLRVLTLTKKFNTSEFDTQFSNVFSANIQCTLPNDYLHILNVVCEFLYTTTNNCRDCGKIVVGAKKMDTNKWPTVISNYYDKPLIRQPYYYIINLLEPNQTIASVNDPRHANVTLGYLLIKCGNLKKTEKLNAVYMDYLRAPKQVELSIENLDDATDLSEYMEFPDYVNYEIINEFVKLVLENAKDPRISTFPQVTTTV